MTYLSGTITRKLLPAFCILFSCAILGGCSSGPKQNNYIVTEEHDLPAVTARLKHKKLWSYKVNGNLSYVSLANDSSRAFFSSSADSGNPRGFEARVRQIDSAGKLRWSHWLKSAVKGQTTSENGALSAATNYEDKVYVFDEKGKTVWERNHLGTPYFLKSTSKVLILNDDDSSPDTAFFIYDLKAGDQSSKPNEVKLPDHSEAVETAFSDFSTGHIVSTVTTRKNLFVYDLDINQSSDIKLEMFPIASVAYKNMAFVLMIDRKVKGAQNLIAYDWKKKSVLWQLELQKHFEGIKIIPDEKNPTLLLYGNSNRGQLVSGFRASDGLVTWEYSWKKPAVYWSSFVMLERNEKHDALVGLMIDRNAEDAGALDLVAINAEGKLVVNIPVDAPNGIFGFSLAQKNLNAVIATGSPGDAVLEYYKSE